MIHQVSVPNSSRVVKMLDRVSRGQSHLDTFPPRQTSNRNVPPPIRNRLKNTHSLSELTSQFRNALKKSVQGIVEAGLVLIQAKSELEHGEFIDWVVNELRFGTRKAGAPHDDIRKAQMVMFVARNEVISNANHWFAFPPSWRTLYELTHIRPKSRLLQLIADGTINPSMTREEAIALRHGASQERSPTPTIRLKREIAALVDVCIFLGGGDGVLSHIRGIDDMANVPAAAEFDRASRWVKRKLVERRRAK
jgi:hypothetical protein